MARKNALRASGERAAADAPKARGWPVNARMADGKVESASVGAMAGAQRSCYYGGTQAEVLDKPTKARNDVRLGLPVAANRQPVADFLTRWLEESAGPRIKPRTYERFS